MLGQRINQRWCIPIYHWSSIRTRVHCK
jgi:hypothetical protein